MDDAGRGPVIGPLVIAGIAIEERRIDDLRSLGVKDSKMLLASTRTRLSKEIPGVIEECQVVELEARELDRIA